jgi:hypothetical protein
VWDSSTPVLNILDEQDGTGVGHVGKSSNIPMPHTITDITLPGPPLGEAIASGFREIFCEHSCDLMPGFSTALLERLALLIWYEC